MIKTLTPYSNTAKTAEIMSRYRPIAPKPDCPSNSEDESSSMSQKIRQSPYLRNLWPQLQARPTRTRKRGRGALSPPVVKRLRTHQMFSISPPAEHLGMQGFYPTGFSQLPTLQNPGAITSNSVIASPSSLVTLPLLSPSPAFQGMQPHELMRCMAPSQERDIDLNTVVEIPEEKDLLRQLQERHATTTNVVIAPQPVRPVVSTIRVGCINETPGVPPVQYQKKPEQVEEEVESDVLPAVISDSNNKVRLANSAYKEMVGQPECSWLNLMVTGNDRLGFGSSCCQRISGEVALHLSDSKVPVSSNGFSCWVSIEWGSQGKKSSVNAFCDVIRLSCKSKDYLFTWRFHTPLKEAVPWGFERLDQGSGIGTWKRTATARKAESIAYRLRTGRRIIRRIQSVMSCEDFYVPKGGNGTESERPIYRPISTRNFAYFSLLFYAIAFKQNK